MDRHRRASIARETVTILERGEYVAARGQTVCIAEAVAHAAARTVLHAPHVELPRTVPPSRATSITVANETTLAAAERLSRGGALVAALNFASAKNPGGGFLSGAEAQEESLARASGLFSCLSGAGAPFYAFHRAQGDAFYSDLVIYSPDVPVFRDDDGALIAAPWTCSIITAAAPNRGALVQQGSPRLHELEGVMRSRIDRVLAVAAFHGHPVLVLGAFGCGAFHNDPVMVARLFSDALAGPYATAFEHVHFAVYDRRAGDNFRVFARAFADA